MLRAVYDVDSVIDEPLLLLPLQRAVHEGAPPLYLRSAKLKLTARCNLKCEMCRFGRGWAPPELDEATFARILDELAGFGCRKVHFSGGEVMVRSDFERLAARARSLGMKVTLTSNLTLLTKDRARALMRARPSSISTSLDAARPGLHDRIRGIPGSFRRTVRALERLGRERERRALRTALRVNFTMMRRNFREYPALVDLARELGAADVVPMPVDDGHGASTLRLSKRRIEEYAAEIAPRVLEARQRAGMSTAEHLVHPFGVTPAEHREAAAGRYAGGYYRKHACYAPWLHLFVAWDGKAYLCCMTDGKIEPLGDLSVQSVEQVFTGERFRDLRARMQRERLAECHRCDLFTTENRRLAAALGPPAAGRAGAEEAARPSLVR